MIKKINGFTLIELMLAVTISTMLMISIIVFVSNWINIIKKNDKILSEDLKNIDFEENFLKTISNTNEIYFSWTSFWDYKTWIFLKTSSPNLPITFIWIKTFTGFCDRFWEETINATWTVQKLVIKEFILPEINQDSITLNWISYKLSHTWNIIYSWSEIIIWNWITWNNLNELNPINTQLNYASSITWNVNFLYIADTLNDRILYYNTTNNTIK
jgi:prepilin-type N-terminal cleavage/methylation domain-containing protein